MKFIPTPSASSSFIAGIDLWALFWGILSHMNHAAHMIGLGRFVRQERILDWMTEHKAMTLMMTEVINLGSHGWGMDALGVTFAMGGTCLLTAPPRTPSGHRAKQDLERKGWGELGFLSGFGFASLDANLPDWRSLG